MKYTQFYNIKIQCSYNKPKLRGPRTVTHIQKALNSNKT